MFYAFFAVLCFLFSLVFHIFYCRYTKKTGLHSKVYVLLAITFFVIYVVGAFSVLNLHLFDQKSLWGMPFIITSGIMYVLLIPTYLTFYVLTQLMSPSKKILLLLQKRSTLTFDDVVKGVEEERFIDSRLGDLCHSGCVAKVQGRYVLTPSGRLITVFLDVMQVFLGRKAGG